MYEIEVHIAAIPRTRWKAICTDCSDEIDSVIELLRGQFSKSVMSRLCRQQSGLFPSPSEITLQCSCPDSARLCKHLAAVLYGIGARLDEKPELLFTLRNVNQQELIAHASHGMTKRKKNTTDKILKNDDLSEIFGIDIAQAPTKSDGKRRRRP